MTPENLAKIVELTDGVMVAQGDLGVEMPAETVPATQRKIIARMPCARQTRYRCSTNVGIND